MSVTKWWWERCRGTQKYPGRIIQYNPSSGRWMLQLDDPNYHKTYPMRWDTIRKLADNKAATFNNYTFPFLPITWPLSTDFDDTISSIECITEEMISKFNVNKDELPNDSRQQSGFQAFLLQFGTTVRMMDDLEKTEYIFPDTGTVILNGTMLLRKHDCLVATLRKALQVWRNYTQNVRDAWKERAKLLNAVPVSGLLPSCPEMFWAFNGGVDGAVVKALFHDWKCLCNFIQNSIRM